MNKRTLSLLVDNTPGLLSRVSGLFTRRGYNIVSITAGVTTDPAYTRITIVTEGDEDIIEQIVKQLRKLVDVIISMADVFRGSIVDVASDSLIIEMTGKQDKVDAFIRLLEGYEILELARTGITSLSRGSDDVRYL